MGVPVLDIIRSKVLLCGLSCLSSLCSMCIYVWRYLLQSRKMMECEMQTRHSCFLNGIHYHMRLRVSHIMEYSGVDVRSKRQRRLENGHGALRRMGELSILGRSGYILFIICFDHLSLYQDWLLLGTCCRTITHRSTK